MFLGSYQHTIDDKGRLTLPSKWRESLDTNVVVTRGLDDCLFVIPESKFQTMAEAIDAQGFESNDARDWERYLFGMAEIIEIDKQGRILIPQTLRSQFGLNGEVMIVGVYSRIEIWDPKKYQAMTERITSEPSAIAQRMREMMRGEK